MCGITGYIGERSAVHTAIANLKRLEYRGYDSAGVAYPAHGRILIQKAPGKIAQLEALLREAHGTAHVAIAHTRWATHGRPNEANAHPHADCTGTIAVVHNGIIENHAELRERLAKHGHRFQSETDTEVIAHLIEDYLPRGGYDLEQLLLSTRRALSDLEGSHAVAVISCHVPDAVLVSRKDSPLVVGLAQGESFIASDIPAVLGYTRRVLVLEDGDLALVTRSGAQVFGPDGASRVREPLEVSWDIEAAEKGGHEHFMLKEILEGPRTIRETLRGRLTAGGRVALPDVAFSAGQWSRIERVHIVACGTAFHAGLVGKRMMERLLRMPVEATPASEFRYSDPLVNSGTLTLLISQSGETADTLAALREARRRGSATLSIVNVVGSTLARESDAVLYTQAGPEIGVASTKAYLAQLTALALLSLHLAQESEEAGRPTALREHAALYGGLASLPDLAAACLRCEEEIARLAERLADHHCFFYLGRGYDFATAAEAALKLKEISYLHAEAYPAGEMKHGPLALVEPGVVIVGLCTQPKTHEKMLSNLQEARAREGTVVAVLREGLKAPDCADHVLLVPDAPDDLMPILSIVPLQLLAYHVARRRGCPIDQPRNLAKSVTVE